MYFVDREKITKTLTYMEKIYAEFLEMERPSTVREQLALERMATVIIESIIDVGNAMIDGFIMRDPGSYEDIIDILEDETVVSPEHAEQLKRVVFLRKQLVQQFIDVDHQSVYDVLQSSQQALLQFPKDVRRYLEEELGPVSAFLPEKK